MQKKSKKSNATSGASGRKSMKSASEKRTYVPQLGEQAKQSIPPLKVLSGLFPPWCISKLLKKQRNGWLNGV
jgi:hypothetical protein